MKKYIVANWKMNKSPQESLNFIQEIKNLNFDLDKIETIICPPFTSLAIISDHLKSTSVKLGAQNCHYEIEGAFTGEISLQFLKEFEVSHVIIGHSERRTLFFESDEILQKKVDAALSQNVMPIYCVGETLTERNNNQTWSKIKSQLDIGLKNVDAADWEKLIVAYEPVWAIGTGVAATSSQASEVHDLIRKYLIEKTSETVGNNIPLLYGGSVNASNINELTSQNNINGALVGSASLKIESYASLIQ